MVKEIVSFIRDNDNGYYDDCNLEEWVQEHISYKTCNVIYDKDGEIIAVARWNVEGDTAEILDVTIRKDNRSISTLKELIRHCYKYGHIEFPFVKYIKFERGRRNDMKTRKYKIRRLI
jgi:hypothetical protein